MIVNINGAYKEYANLAADKKLDGAYIVSSFMKRSSLITVNNFDVEIMNAIEKLYHMGIKEYICYEHGEDRSLYFTIMLGYFTHRF